MGGEAAPGTTMPRRYAQIQRARSNTSARRHSPQETCEYKAYEPNVYGKERQHGIAAGSRRGKVEARGRPYKRAGWWCCRWREHMAVGGTGMACNSVVIRMHPL